MFASYKCEKHTLQDIYRSNNSIDARYHFTVSIKKGRQTKSSPKRGGFGASKGLLLAFLSHIGTQKCSNFVVKLKNIVV